MGPEALLHRLHRHSRHRHRHKHRLHRRQGPIEQAGEITHSGSWDPSLDSEAGPTRKTGRICKMSKAI